MGCDFSVGTDAGNDHRDGRGDLGCLRCEKKQEDGGICRQAVADHHGNPDRSQSLCRKRCDGFHRIPEPCGCRTDRRGSRPSHTGLRIRGWRAKDEVRTSCRTPPGEQRQERESARLEPLKERLAKTNRSAFDSPAHAMERPERANVRDQDNDRATERDDRQPVAHAAASGVGPKTSGRRIWREMPVTLSTSRTRFGGHSFHCDNALELMPSDEASSPRLPRRSLSHVVRLSMAHFLASLICSGKRFFSAAVCIDF